MLEVVTLSGDRIRAITRVGPERACFVRLAAIAPGSVIGSLRVTPRVPPRAARLKRSRRSTDCTR
jgi:hypothetical protein